MPQANEDAMTSRNTLTLLLSALLLTTAACADTGEPESDESGGPALTVTLNDSTQDSKADSVWGKKLETDVTETVYFDGSSYEGVSSVSRAVSNLVTVESELLVARPGVNNEFTATVDETGFRTEAFSTVRMLVFYREAGQSDSAWTPIELAGTATSILGGVQPITINSFEKVAIRPNRSEIEFTAQTSTGKIEYVAPFTGGRGLDIEYGVFVFPVDTWGSLKGDYQYEVQVSCDGGGCHKPAALK